MKKEKVIISLDATGKAYGRLASEVAAHVRGKNTTSFVPHVAPEIFVEIEHIEKVKFSGKKFDQKQYHTHTRFPGGYAATHFSEVFKKNPEKTFLGTVRLMLPANKLRKELLKHISFR